MILFNPIKVRVEELDRVCPTVMPLVFANAEGGRLPGNLAPTSIPTFPPGWYTKIRFAVTSQSSAYAPGKTPPISCKDGALLTAQDAPIGTSARGHLYPRQVYPVHAVQGGCNASI